MTEPIHIVDPFLVGQLDAIEDAIEGRRLARSVAVKLEQENAELLGVITDARQWLADDACTCRHYLDAFGSPAVDDCRRCVALAILTPRSGT